MQACWSLPPAAPTRTHPPPAINDHAEVHVNEVEFSFTYAPMSPLPEIGDAASTGTPSIKIVSPKPGDVVKGDFDVVVEVTSYDLNCDLYGKPRLFGIGHYHVNLDSTTGPMMGMGTMLGMGCTTTFTASTEGLATGETHTVIALLADNGHAPRAHPTRTTHRAQLPARLPRRPPPRRAAPARR